MRFIFRKFMSDRHGVAAQVLFLYALLTGFNLLAWVWALISFHHYPILLGTAFLAYSFGLRHAVDADHIAAIDNVTRKLMHERKPSMSVGLFFSLGHSTVVVVLSALVAVTTIAIKGRFNELENVGAVVGTLISAAFLFTIAAVNVIALCSIYKTFKFVMSGGHYRDEDFNLILASRGLLGRVFRRLFCLIEHSWQMYPVGFLFGLGFDTATEVGLLGISATEVTKGLNIWSIMVFPALFTAGMTLVDTSDSVLMAGSYAWALAKPVRKLYYNLTITLISVVIALSVGSLETLGLVQREMHLHGPFWNRVAAIYNNFGLLGYIIIGIFVASSLCAIALYKIKGLGDIDIVVAE